MESFYLNHGCQKTPVMEIWICGAVAAICVERAIDSSADRAIAAFAICNVTKLRSLLLVISP
jgi:hypothetical protein